MIRNNKPIIKMILLSTLCTSILLNGFSYKAYASFPTTKRLAGNDRYATAVKVAQDGWTSSYYAILACGENYPDALSAVPLAKKYDSPILLTYKNSLPADVMEELKSLKVGKVFIIGGTGSVGSNIEEQLAAEGMQIERLGGIDRYDTSVKIAEKFGNVDTLTVATGEDYADAISVGSAAAAMGVPVLLVPRNIMPDTTKQYIRNLNTIRNSEYSNLHNGDTDKSDDNVGDFRNMQIFVVGDNDVVSDNVASEFENTFTDNASIKQYGSVERITGKDKYERNINIIARFIEHSDGNTVNYDDHSNSSDDYKKTQYSTEYDLFSLNNMFVASGDGFADALSGAALAAKTKSPVILSGDSNTQMLKNFILSKIPNYGYNSTAPEYLTVLGGEAVMPDSRVSSIFGTVAFDNTAPFNNSDTAEFKDKQLEKLIRDKVGIHDRELHYSDLKDITSLDLSNQGIDDLTGLDNCSNLKSLDLSYNQITDVLPLLKLYYLEDLNLSHNEIEDISYLSNLRELKQLNLSDNDISTFDYSRENSSDNNDNDYDKISENVFRYLTNLTFLDLSNSNSEEYYSTRNRITSSDLENLNVLTNLTSLNLKGNDLGSLTNLEKLTSLTTLNLSHTDISNLDSVEKLTNLTYLDISNNTSIDGSDLKPLQYLNKLKYLNASSNGIDDLTYIKGLSGLNTLYLEDNPIKDYTPILSYKDSLYYKDFDTSLIDESSDFYSKDIEMNVQIKNEIDNFSTMYGYSDFDKLKYRQLYRPYASEAYDSTLSGLYKERDWKKSQLTAQGLSSTQLKSINDNIENMENQISDIKKKDDMNTKVRDLNNQLVATYNAKDMMKIINNINCVYSDYRYDYYRTTVERCNKEIENMKAQLQIASMQSPSYSGASTIQELQYDIEQRQKDKDFAQEKVNMYDNYRNFFNAISSVIEEN
ncbi:cell wall-binding repeat-containing protein [Clostridium thailandense]|uniref:cell wall-binding repeat-containing protein n=1 Tax=Clostridium thailandense TaxID=2794346 RepID=UPI00398A43BB